MKANKYNIQRNYWQVFVVSQSQQIKMMCLSVCVCICVHWLCGAVHNLCVPTWTIHTSYDSNWRHMSITRSRSHFSCRFIDGGSVICIVCCLLNVYRLILFHNCFSFFARRSTPYAAVATLQATQIGMDFTGTHSLSWWTIIFCWNGPNSANITGTEYYKTNNWREYAWSCHDQ